MKKKIKLRDLTEEQYKKWFKENCIYMNCKTCPFRRAVCSLGNFCWVINKDLYTDKFLDQEFEIEVPELLTKEEKEYLENLLKPFKEVVDYIMKVRDNYNIKEYIVIRICNGECITLPYFNYNEYYKNLEIEKEYTLKDLELFQSKYKITLTEFWNSEDKLAIHCDTRKKADKFIEKSNKTDKWGDFGNCYGVYKEKTCYCNEARFDELEYCRENNYTIYEFEDVDLEN